MYTSGLYVVIYVFMLAGILKGKHFQWLPWLNLWLSGWERNFFLNKMAVWRTLEAKKEEHSQNVLDPKTLPNKCFGWKHNRPNKFNHYDNESEKTGDTSASHCVFM